MDTKYIRFLNEDLSRLKQLLAPLIREQIPDPRSSLRCLNIACGRADESGILRDILSNLTDQLHIIGVDIRERELDVARDRWRNDPHTQYTFLYHDATKLHLINALSEPVDLIIMRHQNYWNGAVIWQKIYDSALNRLKPDGTLIITSYFDKEHLQAMNAIQQLGATLISSIKNPNSRPVLDAPNKSVDRHIAVFKRTKDAGNLH